MDDLVARYLELLEEERTIVHKDLWKLVCLRLAAALLRGCTDVPPKHWERLRRAGFTDDMDPHDVADAFEFAYALCAK